MNCNVNECPLSSKINDNKINVKEYISKVNRLEVESKLTKQTVDTLVDNERKHEKRYEAINNKLISLLIFIVFGLLGLLYDGFASTITK